MNDRPLCRLASEGVSDETLSPSHLMYGRRITTMPYDFTIGEELEDPKFAATGRELKKTVARRQKTIATFWK